MPDPYERRLEEELVSLRHRRVQLRKLIDASRKGFGPGYDATDRIAQRRNLEAAFTATEHRWGELHHALGRRLPGGIVRLDQPRRVAQPRPVVRAVPPRRTISAGGYITKVMLPDR
jgi:hypothetical protein